MNKYKEDFEKLLEKQPMPPPHTKEKVWEEVIETQNETLKIVHDNIEGKRCQVCDKELHPEKQLVYTYNWEGFHFALNKQGEIADKPVHMITTFYYCSRKCREYHKKHGIAKMNAKIQRNCQEIQKQVLEKWNSEK